MTAQRLAKSILSITIALVLLLFVILLFYWTSHYVDETIDSGKRWGIEIGKSEAETLASLQAELEEESARIMVYDDDDRADLLGLLSEVPLDGVQGHDEWHVYWEGTSVSDLRLTFKDGKLYRAHMQERAFELP